MMKKNRRHHGAAMTETVLVLPVLLLILSLLIYFGLSMKRLQRAAVMDRYEAWRQTSRAPGPTNDDAMNAVFFGGNAVELDRVVDFGNFTDAQDVVIEEAATYTDEAGLWAETMFDQLPRVRRVQFTTTHESSVPVWQRFEGTIIHQHTIVDGDWRYARGVRFDEPLDKWVADSPLVDLWEPLRDAHFESLDDILEPLDRDGNELAGVLRGLYLHTPGYGGPDLGEW